MNFRVVDWALHKIVDDEERWSNFFSESGVEPFVVVYEDFVQHYERTASLVLDYLGISLPEGFTFPPPRVHKQADAMSEEWVARYLKVDRTRHKWYGAGRTPAGRIRSRLLWDLHGLMSVFLGSSAAGSGTEDRGRAAEGQILRARSPRLKS
jgi:hypothetical protein